jgi:hypothetical protein
MKHVNEILARLPADEREGCAAAFLTLSFCRQDLDDCYGHPSLDLELYVDSLRQSIPERMTESAAAWVRAHVKLPASLTSEELAAFPPEVSCAGDRATVQTSIGRFAVLLVPLNYVNLDDPAAGVFFDTH